MRGVYVGGPAARRPTTASSEGNAAAWSPAPRPHGPTCGGGARSAPAGPHDRTHDHRSRRTARPPGPPQPCRPLSGGHARGGAPSASARSAAASSSAGRSHSQRRGLWGCRGRWGCARGHHRPRASAACRGLRWGGRCYPEPCWGSARGASRCSHSPSCQGCTARPECYERRGSAHQCRCARRAARTSRGCPAPGAASLPAAR